jgi:hypothetical protein
MAREAGRPNVQSARMIFAFVGRISNPSGKRVISDGLEIRPTKEAPTPITQSFSFTNFEA